MSCADVGSKSDALLLYCHAMPRNASILAMSPFKSSVYSQTLSTSVLVSCQLSSVGPSGCQIERKFGFMKPGMYVHFCATFGVRSEADRFLLLFT